MVFYLAKSAWIIHQVIGEVISNTRQLLQIYTIKEKSNTDLFNKKKCNHETLPKYLLP